jgi:hypothetical protein
VAWGMTVSSTTLGTKHSVPKGPKGQRRPSGVIGAAVKVMRIATGEETEDAPSPARAAATLGKLGGAARARNLTAERRKEIARNGAAKRWGVEQP